MNRAIALLVLFCSLQAPTVDCPLDRWFAGYNETYFNDSLPKNTTVDFYDFEDVKIIGDSFCFQQKCRIRIARQYQNARPVYLETLLHEMCHIDTWDAHEINPHGPKWQTCMHRLANQNAFEDVW